MIGILGKKIGMTQIYDNEGNRVPVTLIEAVPSEVLLVRTTEQNGYEAIQVGIYDKKKKGKNTPAKKFIREIKATDSSEYKVGDTVNLDVFAEGDYVDVTGVSKGKGFQGGVKRFGWKGGKATHGSMHHRRVGSIGASSYPSRVFKGRTMPGHMGTDKKTIQNLKIIKVDIEKNLIAIKGPIVGHNNGYVVIKEALKKPKKVEKNDDK